MRTADLTGHASTTEFTDEVINRVRSKLESGRRSATFDPLRRVPPRSRPPASALGLDDGGGRPRERVRNGVAYPFTVIYLHNVRGFSLGIAGLVLATNAVVGLGAGQLAGVVVDRFGARVTLAVSLLLMAIGFGSFPWVTEPWHAFLASAIAGVGNGGFWPSQSSCSPA